MATHSSVLAWRIPGILPGGAWWAAIYGVAQSWTRLKWLSSSRLHYILNFLFCIGVQPINKQCNSFRWTVKGSSHTYTVVRSPPNSPPIQAGTSPWAEFPVLYSRSLLVICFKYSSVYMSISNSLTIPLCHPSPWEPEIHSLNLWVSFCFVSKFICIISFLDSMY